MYVFEVCRGPEECKQLYPKIQRDISYDLGEIVDINDSDTKEWRIGKIHHKSESIANNVFVVVEGQGKSPSKEIKVDRLSQNIAPLMTHTINYSEIEILPLYHRVFKPDGTIVYFGMPKLLVVGVWATCNQIVAEVMTQAKHFTAVEIRQGHSIEIRPLKSIIGIQTNLKKIPDVLAKSASTAIIKPSPFYNVTMIDTNTDTCAICSSRQLATKKFFGSFKQKTCRGCSLLDNGDLPIK